jgi:hypothetical protein
MDQDQVHFEVFVRKRANDPWTLEMATESRSRALEEAEFILAERRAISVRVTKETLDPRTREFKMVVLLTKGEPDQRKTKREQESFEPLCVSPQDLYSVHARDRVGRLLEGWLTRHKVTPFELLHRADLVERLESSGMDLQHAIQKIAIPEAQAREISVHEVMRAFQKLVEASIDRLVSDARKGVHPKIDVNNFAAMAEKLASDPDRQYLLGAGVAKAIAGADRWSEKVNQLLDLADAAPVSAGPRAFALHVLEQPLGEVLGSRAGLSDLFGAELELGARLAAMTRLAAADSVDALMRIEPSVAKVMPPLKASAARLANWLEGSNFEAVRIAIAKRVLQELSGPRRLCPNDPAGEIDMLRAMAMALTAASGRMLSLEDVQAVFIQRSGMLVRSDFVEAYLAKDAPPLEEVRALLWLAENVTGPANKRHASRWISSTINALRFETAVRNGGDSASAKLAALATLQRAVGRAGLVAEETAPIKATLGEIGGMVEADAKLVSNLVKSGAPVVNRLNALLRMAVGESAPVGPAADRAKTEALKLLRLPATRSELAQTPEAIDGVRGMLKTLGLAA